MTTAINYPITNLGVNNGGITKLDMSANSSILNTITTEPNAYANNPVTSAIILIKEISEPIALAILDQNYNSKKSCSLVLNGMLNQTKAVVSRCLTNYPELWSEVQNNPEFSDLVKAARDIHRLSII